MRLATAVAAAVMVVAQLDMRDGMPARCWMLEGVAAPTTTGAGPFYLNRNADLGGWMIWAPVVHGDRDAAARAVGFKSAKDCQT